MAIIDPYANNNSHIYSSPQSEDEGEGRTRVNNCSFEGVLSSEETQANCAVIIALIVGISLSVYAICAILQHVIGSGYDLLEARVLMALVLVPLFSFILCALVMREAIDHVQRRSCGSKHIV